MTRRFEFILVGCVVGWIVAVVTMIYVLAK